MKYSIVGIFGGFILFVTLVFSDSKLYAEGSEKESGWTLGADNKNILYVAHWTHTPENCPGRSAEGAKMLNKFWEGRKKAEEKGIRILGAYVTVTEHDYFIVFEANDYSAALEFFLPLVPSQTSKIAPVLTMDDWLKIMPK